MAVSRIGFIGLGKLGLPCAAAFSVMTSSRVVGFDVSPAVKSYVESCQIPYMEVRAEEFLEKADLLIVDSVSKVVELSNIIFVAVQTPHESQHEGNTPTPSRAADFDYRALIAAVHEVRKSLDDLPNHRLSLVVISTVLPGTMRDQILPILRGVEDRVDFFYNPYFIAMGNTISDFLNPEFTLVGTTAGSEAKDSLARLYSQVHSAPVRFMAIESAELTKVAYNTFIGFKIVFANTIAEIVEARGGHADEVTSALAMATDRLISGKYLSAGMGDGGGCHPRDQIAMSWMAEEAGLSSDLFGHLARARDSHTESQALLIKSHCDRTGMPVVLLGEAYKADVNLVVGSPASLLGHYLNEMGVAFQFYDPFTRPSVSFDFKKSVFFVSTNHTSFRDLELPEGSIVIDPWGSVIKAQEGVQLLRPGRPW